MKVTVVGKSNLKESESVPFFIISNFAFLHTIFVLQIFKYLHVT
jgi:hypothetical protein